MRWKVLLLALVGFSLPSFGAKWVTVEELEHTLSAEQGLPDSELAKELSGLELTERLSPERLEHLKTHLPGKQARQPLTLLGDRSVFLDLPAAENGEQTSPDLAAQRQMLALTVNYVTQTLRQLPNFFATRATESFQDSPAIRSITAFRTLYLGY